ncbi:hypothetical protein L484_003401 [Morus notabilis]|uniref:Uncharacterized protein n=1 Tax=Morus notabilis TaxID=981085 RepID=W9RM36_9ROSA|nr:hypothetical protein L484_003401 [Morus notabilis]
MTSQNTINEPSIATKDNGDCSTLSECLNEKFNYGAHEQQQVNHYNLAEYYWGVGNSIWTLQDHEPAAQVARSSALINANCWISTSPQVEQPPRYCTEEAAILSYITEQLETQLIEGGPCNFLEDKYQT